MKKVSVNHGSAIVEMTMLIPIILGVIYLYITLLLFLVESAKHQGIMAEELYSLQTETSVDMEKKDFGNGQYTKSQQGNIISIFVRDEQNLFDIELELHRKGDSAVQNIRRWQLATDTLRTGTNE